MNWNFDHFKPGEFNHPEKMNLDHIQRLDILRANIGKSINLSNDPGADFREGDKGYHGKGLATDVNCPGLSLFEFYQEAERHNFSGIGLYPQWNTPGLHLDSRPLIGGRGARWICIKVNGKQEYVALNAENLKKYVLN